MNRVDYHEPLTSVELESLYESSPDEVRKLVSTLLSMVPRKDAVFMTWNATKPEGLAPDDEKFAFTGAAFIGTNQKMLGFFDMVLDTAMNIDESGILLGMMMGVLLDRFNGEGEASKMLKEAMQNVN